MKLKAGISSSPCREASETEFLELMYRLMMTLLTGILNFLKEGRRAGVFGVSDLIDFWVFLDLKWVSEASKIPEFI